ncbi:hypothetical protein QTP86_021402 [Hemibagrus guttatus]|nr:hypothetical protein QTP86_021402 [Hemibagrus guttatus]
MNNQVWGTKCEGWEEGRASSASAVLVASQSTSNSTRSALSCLKMAEKFDNLEEHLEKFIENIRQLGIIVSDFQPSSQTGLNQKLNLMITGLQDIEKCRQQLNDIHVPLEAFEYIDQGRNPQLYTKECLERALAKNEQVKGKIDTLTKFKSLLIVELGKVFPEEMAKYKAIHGDDPPS